MLEEMLLLAAQLHSDVVYFDKNTENFEYGHLTGHTASNGMFSVYTAHRGEVIVWGQDFYAITCSANLAVGVRNGIRRHQGYPEGDGK